MTSIFKIIARMFASQTPVGPSQARIMFATMSRKDRIVAREWTGYRK